MSFPHKNNDENEFRRQKVEFPAPKRRRERVSSPKNSIFGLKTTTRTGLVTKKGSFPPQKDDDKGCRRQKVEFSTQKRRRERVSSPKRGDFRTKTTTRTGLVPKKWSFRHKNDDENGPRRQKVEFSTQKRRRERVSSPKSGDFRTKTTTRTGLVAKKWSFRHKNDDENGSRRQKVEFSTQKRRRERVSSPKNSVSGPKKTTRTSFVAKKRRFPHKNDDENEFRRQKSEFSAQKRRRERPPSPKAINFLLTQRQFFHCSRFPPSTCLYFFLLIEPL
ncbi:hypothetical protein [Caldibacillus thermoamylovorans]|uniref:hypothetical protein n=1 Tax=Caldibacillus thermoamylovorans TaxID=35841 RepID=UPI0022E8F0A1|nr:hypothetical protein [Caldibacillus thermoamylovorans]